MKKILTLTAITALIMGTTAPIYAQNSVPHFDQVNEREDLSDEEKAVILGLTLITFLALAAGSGGSGSSSAIVVGTSGT